MAAFLEDIRLKNNNGRVVWEWTGETSIFRDVSDVRIRKLYEQDKTILLEALSSDPKLGIVLPDEVLSRVGAEWSVEITLVPQTPLVNSLLGQIHGLEGRIRGLEAASVSSPSSG